jgi:hypothetical protein
MTKVKIFLILLIVAISGMPIPPAISTTNFYAGGQERNYDKRYRDVPGAYEC